MQGRIFRTVEAPIFGQFGVIVHISFRSFYDVFSRGHLMKENIDKMNAVNLSTRFAPACACLDQQAGEGAEVLWHAIPSFQGWWIWLRTSQSVSCKITTTACQQTVAPSLPGPAPPCRFFRSSLFRCVGQGWDFHNLLAGLRPRGFEVSIRRSYVAACFCRPANCKVASQGVEECQSFEITNLMWALAELCLTSATNG